MHCIYQQFMCYPATDSVVLKLNRIAYLSLILIFKKRKCVRVREYIMDQKDDTWIPFHLLIYIMYTHTHTKGQ